MELPHESLVQLCIMRRDDMKAAMKEATRIIRYNWRNSTEGRACRAEYSRRYREKVKDQNHPTQKATTLQKDGICVAPESRTEKQCVDFWNDKIMECDRRYNNNEIGFEEWRRYVNIALRHRDAAEDRIKK